MANKRLQGCRFLLGSLVALLIIFPFLGDIARPIIRILPVAGVFVAGVVAVDPGRAHVRLAYILAATQVILTASSLIFRGSPVLYLIALILVTMAITALILLTIYTVLRYVLKARVITPDQIYAGISVYLMLGFAFGAIFYLLTILEPRSFSVNSGTLQPGDTADLMYFSFITLATLGYGDITPISRIGRSLAELEALAGTLYMAVFMARLVSMHSSSSDADELPSRSPSKTGR
jgi:hypothetical protein